MLEIITYQVKPFFLHAHPLPFHPKNATDWLRTVINRLYNSNKGRLRKADAKTEFLHNHNEVTSQTKVLYPLIIYHYFDNGFYVTGINEGKQTLKELFDPMDRAIEIDKNFLLKIERMKEVDWDVKISDTEKHYRLIDWLPLGSDAYKRYHTITLIEKIRFLETQLLKHITMDFGKFLDLDLSGTKVTILSVDNLQRSTLPYKSQDFQPFTIEFTANIELPDFITLGNGKAFGYGRISRIK